MSAVTASFPVRRQDFGFEDVPRHWVDSDPFMTHMFNALSALFPDGERFFVASVRAVREQIQSTATLTRVRSDRVSISRNWKAGPVAFWPPRICPC